MNTSLELEMASSGSNIRFAIGLYTDQTMGNETNIIKYHLIEDEHNNFRV